PPAVSTAPVRAGFAEGGGLHVEPSLALPRTAQTELRRLGVQSFKASAPVPAEPFSCWPQLLPLERLDAAAGVTGQTPVLVELPEPAQLAEIVGEMLRLGNDRQAYRVLVCDGHETLLLRVISPPFYTLLRAIDPERPAGAPRAYLERAPRVW